MKKWLLYGAIAYILVFGFCLFGFYLPNRARSSPAAVAARQTTTAVTLALTASAPTATPSPTDTPIPPTPTATPIPGLGTDVRVGDVRWKIIEVKNEGTDLQSGNRFVGPKNTAGKWVRVRFEIENLGKTPLSYTYIDLVDNQQRLFHSSTDVSGYIPNAEYCGSKSMPSNIPRTCAVLFELPKDAEGLRLVVGDFAMMGATDQQIDLGQ